MTTLLIASRNRHKIEEIRAILGGQFQFFTLNEFPDAPKVVEDANSFAGNAIKKAVELARWLIEKHLTSNIQRPTPDFILADDSGLEVDALNGAPGVHSARFAAENSARSGNTPDTDNNAKLLRLLENVPAEKRTAQFHCVVALTPVPAGKIENASPACFSNELEAQLFDGTCEGKIILAPCGQNGFGYDPLFVPDGFEQTFAELGDDVKNRLSHRARALEKLKRFFTIK